MYDNLKKLTECLSIKELKEARKNGESVTIIFDDQEGGTVIIEKIEILCEEGAVTHGRVYICGSGTHNGKENNSLKGHLHTKTMEGEFLH